MSRCLQNGNAFWLIIMTQTRNRGRPCLRNHVGDMYTCLLQLLWTCWFWDLTADSRHPKDGFESRGRSSYKLISGLCIWEKFDSSWKMKKDCFSPLSFSSFNAGIHVTCLQGNSPKNGRWLCISQHKFLRRNFWDFRGNMDTQIETCFGLCPVYLLLMDLGNEFSHCNNRGKLSVPLS